MSHILKPGDKMIAFGQVVEIIEKRNRTSWWIKTKNGREWQTTRYMQKAINGEVTPSGSVNASGILYSNVSCLHCSCITKNKCMASMTTVLGYESGDRFVIVEVVKP